MSRWRISRNCGRSGSMALRMAITAAAILVLCSSVLGASGRPRSGEGVLFLRPAFPGQANEMKAVVLYVTPGIERIAVVDAVRLPSLFPSVSPPPGVYAVAATEKRGDWFRVAYDDAGREGWIEGRRSWDYFTWQDFLPGRSALLLPDLQAAFTQLRPEPSEESPSLIRVSPEQRIRIFEIRHDWVKVRLEDGLSGWLRWRDRDGKLLLAVEGDGE